MWRTRYHVHDREYGLSSTGALPSMYEHCPVGRASRAPARQTRRSFDGTCPTPERTAEETLAERDAPTTPPQPAAYLSRLQCTRRTHTFLPYLPPTPPTHNKTMHERSDTLCPSPLRIEPPGIRPAGPQTTQSRSIVQPKRNASPERIESITSSRTCVAQWATSRHSNVLPRPT